MIKLPIGQIPAWVLVSFGYLILLMVPFYPLLFQGQALYQGDISIYFEPTLRYLSENIRSNSRLPLWNPLVCGGAPQIAVISPGLFYLPNLLFLLLPYGAALALSLLFHQWLSGLGTYLFLKQMIRSSWACALAGTTVMLSGYMFGSTQCYTLAGTFAWTPIGLATLNLLLSSRQWRWVSALATIVAMQCLAGRPELFLSAALIYLAYAAAWLWLRERASVEARLSASPVPLVSCQLALSLSLGGAIAAVALLPVLELYTLSPRMSGLRFGEVARWSAGWFDWLQVLLIQPFGDLVVSHQQLHPHHPGTFPYISSLFLGAPVVTLAYLGLSDRGWAQRWLWFAVGASFCLLAMGGFGPLLPVLYKLSPHLAVLRYPIKLAVLALFALSVCCGQGLERVLKGGIKGKVWIAACIPWLLASAFAVLILAEQFGLTEKAASAILAGAHSGLEPEMCAALRSAAAQLCLASAEAILTVGLCSLVNSRRRALAACALSLLVVIPLLLNGVATLWHMTDARFYRDDSPVAAWLLPRLQGHTMPVGDGSRALSPQAREDHRRRKSARMLTFLPDIILSPKSMWREKNPLEHSILLSKYERQVLEADVQMNYGLSSSYGLMPTDTKAFMMLYVGVCARSSQFGGPVRLGDVSDLPLFRFCQLTSTRYLITQTLRPEPIEHVLIPQPLLQESGFKLATEMPDLNLRIYEIPDCLPRAYFRANWQRVESQIFALKQIFWADKSNFNPAASVLIVDGRAAAGLALPDSRPAGADPTDGRADQLVPEAVAPVPGTANISARSPTRTGGLRSEEAVVRLVSDSGEAIEIACRCHQPGFLVLADTDYPGWKAYDRGQALPIVQANGFQKAVWLEPGDHRVSFVYRPYSLFWGSILSLGGLVISLSILVVDLVKARSRIEQPELKGWLT